MSNAPKLAQFKYRTARGRLAYYKAYAAWISTPRTDCPRCATVAAGDYRDDTGQKRTQCAYCEARQTWRDVRKYLYAPYSARASKSVNITRDSEHGTLLFADSFDALGWRDIGDAHDVARSEGSRSIDHTGYYADNVYSCLVIGHVLQLPARDGVCQYVPATYCNDSEGVTVYLSDICDSKLDAAKMADECARIDAEHARDQEAQYQAESEIEAKREEIVFARRECLKLLREMRPLRKRGAESPAICRTLRAGVAHYLDDIREARERIAALTENYWLSVE